MDANAARSYCASYSIDGVNGWFLPNKDQLNQMYNNKKMIGGFKESKYWSGSRNGDHYEYYSVYFLNGKINIENWEHLHYARPIKIHYEQQFDYEK